jgi:hypothetical protein
MVASQPPDGGGRVRTDLRSALRIAAEMADRATAAAGRATEATMALTRVAELAVQLAESGDHAAARLILAAIDGRPFTVPAVPNAAGATPADIAGQAIGLFIEFRDAHGQDEDTARASAVQEVADGCAVPDAELAP